MNVLSLGCRGCDYSVMPGRASLNGHDIAVFIKDERCPRCGGRMQELHYQRLTTAMLNPK
jgi:hypothetical protein